MKNLILLFLGSFIINLTFAQVQRKSSATIDSLHQSDQAATAKKGKGNMQMLKTLNLTTDQKTKLKEIQQATKASREEVMADDKLTEEQKTEKVKELKKDAMKKMQAILTPEQKAQLMKMRRENRAKEKAGTTAEEPETMNTEINN